MKIDKKYLSLAAVCLGLVVFVSIVLGLISRARNKNDAAQSVAASAEPVPPAPFTAPPSSPSPQTDPTTPSEFGAAQDDTHGFDGYDWNATVADIAGRRAKPQPGFTIDSATYNGALDLPTIIWMGIGLPSNHQQAQADTFDPASFKGAEFSTMRRGRTQYIFADGHFVMAVVGIDADQYERVRQKLMTANEEIPSLRTEQTFDLAQVGSGLPPDTVSTECFRKPNTNTRIYLIEKWSSSLLGTVTYHRVFEVYIPNADYLTLLNEATHPDQTAAAPPAAHP
jgi:hypothetical protein